MSTNPYAIGGATMLYRFNFYEDERLVKVNVFGKTDKQRILSRLVRLINDPRWKEGYKVLVDYTGVTSIDGGSGNVETPWSLLKEIPEDRIPIGVAYVLPERLFHQFDRMPTGVAYVLAEGPDQPFIHPILSLSSIRKGLKVNFFRDESKAMKWLVQLEAEAAPVD
ncbi:MAG: hypothetical protein PVH30_10515 [Desulfobacterales bacterium]